MYREEHTLTSFLHRKRDGMMHVAQEKMKKVKNQWTKMNQDDENRKWQLRGKGIIEREHLMNE